MEINSLAIVSHEFKMPLAVICGNMEVLKKYYELGRINDIDMPKYIDSVRQNCDKLVRLTNNLIDLSREDFTQIALDNEVVDFGDMTRDLAYAAQEYFLTIDITIEMKNKIPKIVCDISKMERVFLNLISNSVKYAGDNAEIEIVLENKEDYIDVTFKDNGEGISAEFADEIFKPYFQIADVMTRAVDGSGLGLAIVQKFLNLHGGDISLINQPKGCAFSIKIPHNLDKQSSLAQSVTAFKNIKDTMRIEFSDIG